MAKIFKPRRALRSSVKSGSKRTLVLASGELMMVGKSAIGENSKADLYLGDGVSQIQNLTPAMYGDTSEEDMTITDDTSTSATAALGNVTTGATLGNILGSLKRAISLNASAIATLNDEFVTRTKSLKSTDIVSPFRFANDYFSCIGVWGSVCMISAELFVPRGSYNNNTIVVKNLPVALKRQYLYLSAYNNSTVVTFLLTSDYVDYAYKTDFKFYSQTANITADTYFALNTTYIIDRQWYDPSV